MAYSSPLLLPFNDTRIPYKLTKHTIRTKYSLSSQLQDPFFMAKDPSTKDFTLPELKSHDSKLAHRRKTVSKTKTLPQLKISEDMIENKQKKPSTDTSSIEHVNFPTVAGVITMKKVLHSSILKPKMHFHNKSEYLNKENETKLETNNFEDISNQKNLNLIEKSPNRLYPSIQSPKSSSFTRLKSHCSRTLSLAAYKSTSISDRKEANDDPFFFFNILKNINFSSFQSILEGLIEAYCNSFPYYSRVIKNFSKIKPVDKKIEPKQPKSYYKCLCYTEKNTIGQDSGKKVENPVNLKKLKKILPGLTLLKTFEQIVRFPGNIIIINFEGTLGYCKKDVFFKSGLLKRVKKLSIYFKIVIILSTIEEKTSAILERFERQKIKLSGVYQFIENSQKNRELCKMQDYSIIYSDYQIKDPSKEVLIISCHKYIEDFETIDERILLSKIGIGLKLNVERVPVSSKEYPKLPFNVVLPHFLIKKKSNLLKRIVKTIHHYDENSDANQLSLDFSQALSSNFSIISTSGISRIILDSTKPQKKIKKNDVFCKLHQKYSSKGLYLLAENKFIIN